MAVKGCVPDNGIIVPHLVVRDTAEAIDFYRRAFAAEVLYRSPSASGDGEHIHLKIWSSLVQISTEEPAQRREHIETEFLASPETLGGSTCLFQIGVPDVDAAYRHAIDSGAVPAFPPKDMFWGDRYGWVRDPFGHMWALCSVQEVLTPKQIEERMRATAQTKGRHK